MLLYIIRHADPIYDPDSLTPRGHEQARALAKRLAMHGLDALYSSPLIRAQQTAQPTAELLRLPVQIEEWTREVWPEFALTLPDGRLKFCMDIDNTLYKTPEALAAHENWPELKELKTIDAKAAFARVVADSDAFFAKLGYVREGGVYRVSGPDERRIALFCHGGFILVWLAHLLQIPPHLLWSSFSVNHSGVTILEWRPNAEGLVAPNCLCFSDLSHLYGERLPYRFSNNLYL